MSKVLIIDRYKRHPHGWECRIRVLTPNLDIYEFPQMKGWGSTRSEALAESLQQFNTWSNVTGVDVHRSD